MGRETGGASEKIRTTEIDATPAPAGIHRTD
jgi:hypothetical protein